MGFVEIVVGLLIAIIWIVSIVRKATEDQRQREGQGQRRAPSPWRILTDKDELRRILEEASRKSGVTAEGERGPQTRESTPFVARTLPGVPTGRVTPTSKRRAPKHFRVPATEERPEPKRSVEERLKAPSVGKRELKTRTFASDKRTFEGGLEKRMRSRAAKKPRQPSTAPAAPTVPAQAAAAEPAAAGERIVPRLSRANLRRAIVMNEVLGPPVALQGPRF